MFTFQKPTPTFSPFIEPSRWIPSLYGFTYLKFFYQAGVYPTTWPCIASNRGFPSCFTRTPSTTLSQPQGAQSSVQGRRRDFLQKNVRPLPGGAWQRGGCHCWKVEFLSVAICSSQIKDNTEVRVKVPNHCSKGKLKTKQNRSWLDLPSFCGILILHHLSWAVVPSFPVFPLPLVLNITFKKSILWTLGASSFSGLNLRVTGTWHLFCRLKT